MSEWVNRLVNGWMDEWMGEWLSRKTFIIYTSQFINGLSRPREPMICAHSSVHGTHLHLRPPLPTPPSICPSPSHRLPRRGMRCTHSYACFRLPEATKRDDKGLRVAVTLQRADRCPARRRISGASDGWADWGRDRRMTNWSKGIYGRIPNRHTSMVSTTLEVFPTMMESLSSATPLPPPQKQLTHAWR